MGLPWHWSAPPLQCTDHHNHLKVFVGNRPRWIVGSKTSHASHRFILNFNGEMGNSITQELTIVTLYRALLHSCKVLRFKIQRVGGSWCYCCQALLERHLNLGRTRIHTLCRVVGPWRWLMHTILAGGWWGDHWHPRILIFDGQIQNLLNLHMHYILGIIIILAGGCRRALDRSEQFMRFFANFANCW